MIKKRMYKYLRRAAWCAGVLLGLAVLADVALRVVSSHARVRRYAAQKIAQTTGRQVELEKLSASLSGVRVGGFKLSEAGGFENGTFAEVDGLSVGYSPFHLLHKHIVIHHVAVRGVKMNIIKNEDGTLNTDDLASAPVKEDIPANPEKPFGWRLSWKRLFLDKMNISYQDKGAGLELKLSRFYLEGNTISLRRDFNFESNWQADYSAPGRPAVQVRGGVAGVLNLGGLDWAKAFVRIKDLVLRYGDTPATLSGTVENFINPSVDLTLLAEDFSNRTLADFVPGLPEFSVPRMSLRVKAAANPAQKSVTLNYLAFRAPGAEAAAQGGLLYAGAPDYDVRAAVHVNLAELADISRPLAELYQPSGHIGMQAEAKPGALNVQTVIKDVGAHIPDAGRLSALHAQIKMSGARDVQVTELHGVLNGRKFSGSASYLDKKTYRNIGVWMKADGLTLLSEAEAEAEVQAASGGAAAPETDASSAPAVAAAPKTLPAEKFVPLNVKLALESGPVQARYFYTNALDLDVALSSVTPDLSSAHGTVNVHFKEGEIRDIYKLTDANAVTKMLFLSLNVVSRVINSLNVLDLLSSLAGDTVSGDKRPKTAGEMPFDSFAGVMDFNHGAMTMKQGAFVSDMMSLKIAGTTDFSTGKVDMQVNAAPGKHYEDGIMPITISVGGTVDDPKGSVRMLSSAAALVTQSVTNNFASNAVKKGVGGFFGLFKKKKEEPVRVQEDEFIPIDPAAVLPGDDRQGTAAEAK